MNHEELDDAKWFCNKCLPQSTAPALAPASAPAPALQASINMREDSLYPVLSPLSPPASTDMDNEISLCDPTPMDIDVLDHIIGNIVEKSSRQRHAKRTNSIGYSYNVKQKETEWIN
ncbi:hypothetical protein O3P69_018210 [Scylla paramamosain]|uniref:Uncharacterized protein n=1 Tax=Scylla paramamosain TaxID=85552 RepID=A0AAW0TLJ1_SCYPA